MDTTAERRIRRKAGRLGLTVWKPRAGSPFAHEFSPYTIVEDGLVMHGGQGLELLEAERFLDLLAVERKEYSHA